MTAPATLAERRAALKRLLASGESAIDVYERVPRLPFNRITNNLIDIIIDVELLHDRIGRKTQAHCHHAAPPINELALSVISTFTPSS